MERVYLPSDKCDGIDMPTGEHYNAPKGAGYVEVNDLHAGVLKAFTGLQVGRRHNFASAPSKVCSICGFEQLTALAGPTCKCGGSWEPPVQSAEPVLPDGIKARKVYDI